MQETFAAILRSPKIGSGSSYKIANLKIINLCASFPLAPSLPILRVAKKKLVIEVDGKTHSTPEELAYDNRRTAFLVEQGYAVIRFQNIELFEGMDHVLVLILEALKR
jgi:Protein of unknown function (DUF559)